LTPENLSIDEAIWPSLSARLIYPHPELERTIIVSGKIARMIGRQRQLFHDENNIKDFVDSY
jgi:hypothetical protein